MSNPVPGGRRRIDRVLADDYLSGLADRDLDVVRHLRREAEQEEADLSYVRRMLQGRMDILRAELTRRAAPGSPEAAETEDIVARLAPVLADAERSDRGLGRFLTVEPSRVDEHRRRMEQAIGDVGLSEVETKSEEEILGGLTRLEEMESEVSDLRRRVQRVMDGCSAEITRRYREGAARVEDLLPEA